MGSSEETPPDESVSGAQASNDTNSTIKEKILRRAELGRVRVRSVERWSEWLTIYR
jgi:hypothetical protein